MNKKHYEVIENILKQDKIGKPKMIRIYKSLAIRGVSKKEAISFILYEDIKFILDTLLDVENIYAKTVDFYNTIIILKHKNKSLSHISLHLYDEKVKETFRLEIAGTKGLTEFDSDKSSPIFYNFKQDTKIKDFNTDFHEEEQYMKKSNRIDVLEIIKKIQSLEVTK